MEVGAVGHKWTIPAKKKLIWVQRFHWRIFKCDQNMTNLHYRYKSLEIKMSQPLSLMNFIFHNSTLEPSRACNLYSDYKSLETAF